MSETFKRTETNVEVRICSPELYAFVADVYNHYMDQGGTTMDTHHVTVDEIQSWA